MKSDRSKHPFINERVADFLERFALDKQSEEEHEEFLLWLQSATPAELKSVDDAIRLIQEAKSNKSIEYPEIAKSIEVALDNSRKVAADSKVRRISLTKAGWIAASIVVGLTSILYLVNFQSKTTNGKQSEPSTAIIPSLTNRLNRVSLTLADGSVIYLDSVENGILATQSGSKVRKFAPDELIYDAAIPSNGPVKPEYNTVSIPRGRQYKIVLPDNSSVWLNAGSTLTFPTYFSGNRKVELNGEGYFEVTKNESKPFLVVSGKQTTEVLGTHFNVNAYDGHEEIRTTLLEGSVRIYDSLGSQQKILRPGQQSKLKRTLSVYTVNTKQVIAWMSGYFVFEHQSIQNIMQQIERWYDVKIIYEGKVTSDEFTGSVRRYQKVSDVLHDLEQTRLVRFKIEGNVIIVRP